MRDLTFKEIKNFLKLLMLVFIFFFNLTGDIIILFRELSEKGGVGGALAKYNGYSVKFPFSVSFACRDTQSKGTLDILTNSVIEEDFHQFDILV